MPNLTPAARRRPGHRRPAAPRPPRLIAALDRAATRVVVVVVVVVRRAYGALVHQNTGPTVRQTLARRPEPRSEKRPRTRPRSRQPAPPTDDLAVHEAHAEHVALLHVEPVFVQPQAYGGHLHLRVRSARSALRIRHGAVVVVDIQVRRAQRRASATAKSSPARRARGVASRDL